MGKLKGIDKSTLGGIVESERDNMKVVTYSGSAFYFPEMPISNQLQVSTALHRNQLGSAFESVGQNLDKIFSVVSSDPIDGQIEELLGEKINEAFSEALDKNDMFKLSPNQMHSISIEMSKWINSNSQNCYDEKLLGQVLGSQFSAATANTIHMVERLPDESRRVQAEMDLKMNGYDA